MSALDSTVPYVAASTMTDVLPSSQNRAVVATVERPRSATGHGTVLAQCAEEAKTFVKRARKVPGICPRHLAAVHMLGAVREAEKGGGERGVSALPRLHALFDAHGQAHLSELVHERRARHRPAARAYDGVREHAARIDPTGTVLNMNMILAALLARNVAISASST